MEKFAFIIHPLSIHDMAHVSPVLKFIPDSWLESALKLKKPFQVSHITGIRALTQKRKAGLSAVP